MVKSGGHRVDVCLVIKERLEALGFGQKELAAAAQVTESYVSQLLTRKKLPPAPDRTDIYEKIGTFLRLPSGKLAKLAGTVGVFEHGSDASDNVTSKVWEWK